MTGSPVFTTKGSESTRATWYGPTTREERVDSDPVDWWEYRGAFSP